jgi:hypothetical protein
MRHVRDVAIWLVAPLLASSLCTLGWTVIAEGDKGWIVTADEKMADLRFAVAIGIASLIYTIGGSTMLSLMFAGMSARSAPHRYFILLVLGAVAGGFLMLVSGGSWLLITAGTIYGVVTACFWVALHSVVHGSRQVR